MDRRSFLRSTAAATGALALSGCDRRPVEDDAAGTSTVPPSSEPSDPSSPPRASVPSRAGEPEGRRGDALGGARPAAISSDNGLASIALAMERIRGGGDTLDAVVEGVGLVEADPEDTSVGYGGLPNEDGVVQLDASVMHGPTRGAGAVAAIEEIVHPARVAQQVMQNTDHVLLVGRDATRFALKMGHQRQDLLTPETRQRWLEWKRGLTDRDDWIAPEERLPAAAVGAAGPERDHGTIHCAAIDAGGGLSGVTSTSGLAWKIAGRVGDSPILGAGLYLDNDVGSCGSTGRGEANLKTCASFLGVELMRLGHSPEEAGLRVLQRIAENTVEPYLLDDDGRPRFQVLFYLLDTRGRFAGVSMWSGPKFAADDGSGARLHETAYLYRRAEPA